MAYVRRLSIEKAAAAMESPLASSADIVLAADTTVEVNGEILEKPLDVDDAYRMLRMLSRSSGAHRRHRFGAVDWRTPLQLDPRHHQGDLC